MTMLKSVFIVSFIQQQSPIHNTACVSALQMNSDLPCLFIIIQFRGFMLLLMALQHQGFQCSYSSVMPQPLRHANAGVLQSSNMKKVRLTNTWRIELRPHYDRNEKKKKSVLQKSSIGKAVLSHQAASCFANASAHPDLLSLKKPN